METVKLYKLAEEAMRVLQFIDFPLEVSSFTGSITIHCIVVKYIITESSNEKRILDLDRDLLGKKEVRIFNDFVPSRKIIDIRGNLLALGREGFLEIDVTGFRICPTFEGEDVQVIFKDPISRDAEYVFKNYPDAHEMLLNSLKESIEFAIMKKEKKKYNLARLIDYIKELDAIKYLEKDDNILSRPDKEKEDRDVKERLERVEDARQANKF